MISLFLPVNAATEITSASRSCARSAGAAKGFASHIGRDGAAGTGVVGASSAAARAQVVCDPSGSLDL